MNPFLARGVAVSLALHALAFATLGVLIKEDTPPPEPRFEPVEVLRATPPSAAPKVAIPGRQTPPEPSAPRDAPLPPAPELPARKIAPRVLAPRPRAPEIPAAQLSAIAPPPAPATYLQDARARIEAQFPSRFPPPIRDALARAGGPLRAILHLDVDPEGALISVAIARSSGAPDVDEFLLRLARRTERFLAPPEHRAFPFQVPLEIYAEH